MCIHVRQDSIDLQLIYLVYCASRAGTLSATLYLTTGHLGPGEAQLKISSSLAGSGIGVWADMDQLVVEEASLAALGVVVPNMVTMRVMGGLL